MKILKKIKVINWHHISDETISLEQTNFLTGKTGVGKSTLIDAIQLVLQGTTRGNFFNKAAANKGDRTLIGYAKGEIGDKGDSFTYLRDGGFTTHIALEFYDDIKKKSFILGFAMDVESNDQYENNFYWCDARIDDINFLKGEYHIDIDELKMQIKEIGCSGKIYDKQLDYRDQLRVKLGHLNHSFFSLVRKAAAFTPITDIQGFITEFICDTKSEVQVQHMQENINQYERLKYECECVERMVESLESIQEEFKNYSDKAEYLSMLNFFELKALAELKHEEIENAQSKLHNLKKATVDSSDRAMQLAYSEKSLKIKLDSAREKTNEFKALEVDKRLTEEIEQIKKLCKLYEESYKDKSGRLLRWTSKWRSVLELYKGNPVDEIGSLDLDVSTLVQSLVGYTFDVDFEEYLDEFSHIKSDVTKLDRSLSSDLREKKNDLDNEKLVSAKLTRGQRRYRQGLTETRSIIQNRLSNKYNQDIEISIFCEKLDIKNDEWRDAVEGYLGNRRFNLIVDPKYYNDALDVYTEVTRENNYHGFALVDIDGVMSDIKLSMDNSLYSEVESSDTNVLSYASYLLGHVIKCESYKLLKHYKTSITSDCFLHKAHATTRMNPRNYQIPYIGMESLRQQRKDNLERIASLSNNIDILERKLNVLSKFKDLHNFSDEDITDYDDAKAKKKSYDEGLILIREKGEEKDRLDLTAAEVHLKKIADMEEQHTSLIKDQVREENSARDSEKQANDMVLNVIPKLEAQRADMRNTIINDFNEQERVKFTNAYKEELLKRHTHDRMRKFGKNRTAANEEKTKVYNRLVDLRNDFERRENRKLGTTSTVNTAYDDELTKLSETKIPEYKEKIEIELERAQDEFKNDFIAKLKSNIEDVKYEINVMNNALKSNVFGRDRYQFKVSANDEYKKFYNMIMDDLLMEGYGLMYEPFQTKHKDALQELFQKIIDTGDGHLSPQQVQENIVKYTDYRTYLDFDLVVTDEDGNTQHLSKMITKKSGGETETPFYISILASFYRLYSMRKGRGSETCRLVILDEAFNKMDNERVSECMLMMKELGFQSIVCAPPNKASHVLPHADMSLCCVRPSKTTLFLPWKQAVEGGLVLESDE